MNAKFIFVFFAIFISLNVVSCKKYTGRFQNYLNHSCIRDCSAHPESMICEYDWTLEYYSSLGRACYKCPQKYEDCFRENCVVGDGVQKALETINRMLPGPSVQVCRGDTVIINVENRLRSQRATSIHWHGLPLKGFPHMDGTGMISQCPIYPHSSFQYKFTANDSGTYWWHSHLGVQRADGVFGAFIVRDKKELDPNSHLYDFDLKEHYIMIIEWTRLPFQIAYAPILHGGYYTKEHVILINGKGQLNEEPHSKLPLEVYHVEKGHRYRFRLINSVVQYCMMQLSIVGHNLTVIATDGQPIDPIEVETIVSNAGERFDFVVNTNQEERDYWIIVRGEGDCHYNRLSQRAVLRYKRSSDSIYPEFHSLYPFTFEDSLRTGLQLRTYETEESVQPYIKVDQLKYNSKDMNREDFFKKIQGIPDRKVYLTMDLEGFNDPEFHQKHLYPMSKSLNWFSASVIDHIKFIPPSIPPLFDWDKLPLDEPCNYTNREKSCDSKNPHDLCECFHLLEFNLNDLVELIVIDPGSLPEPHAVHLHGHHFAVLGLDKVSNIYKWDDSKILKRELVQKLDEEGYLKRNFDRPPVKDTITMPTKGYVIIRFIADNPGLWLFHCHLETHSENGMTLAIRVGGSNDLPPKPKNWPECQHNFDDKN